MRVCVERGLQLYKKTMPLPKINLYVPVNNCLESRFKPYFSRRERTTTTLRFLPLPPPFLAGLQSNSGLWIDDVRLSVRLSVCPSVCLSVRPSVCQHLVNLCV